MSKIESGERGAGGKSLRRLALVYGLPVDDLLRRAEGGRFEVPPTPEQEIANRLARLEERLEGRVPIVAAVACGLDIEQIERDTGELSHLHLPDLPRETRAVIARRDSMEGVGILDGDFLLVVPHETDPIAPGERALAIIRPPGQGPTVKEVHIKRQAMDIWAYPRAGPEKIASVTPDEGGEWAILARVIAVYRKSASGKGR